MYAHAEPIFFEKDQNRVDECQECVLDVKIKDGWPIWSIVHLYVCIQRNAQICNCYIDWVLYAIQRHI